MTDPTPKTKAYKRNLIIRIESLTKIYDLGEVKVPALNGVDIDIEEGSYVAIMGPSGSGKSTMLNILGCLDRPTSGQYFLGEQDVSLMSDNELSAVRGQRIGFIFQSYNLIPQLDVVENIHVPLFYQGKQLATHRSRCEELAELVGLGDRLDHRPLQLSGGQQQRVAVARSLVNDPLMVLADEPTGNLDTKTGQEILELLDKLHADGKTIIVVTHGQDVANRAERVIHLKDGIVDRDVYNGKPIMAELVKKPDLPPLPVETGEPGISSTPIDGAKDHREDPPLPPLPGDSGTPQDEESPPLPDTPDKLRIKLKFGRDKKD
jgi:putative ABC transport system ATP-binding protein